jgi:hypothetical protein
MYQFIKRNIIDLYVVYSPRSRIRYIRHYLAREE